MFVLLELGQDARQCVLFISFGRLTLCHTEFSSPLSVMIMLSTQKKKSQALQGFDDIFFPSCPQRKVDVSFTCLRVLYCNELGIVIPS